MTEEERRRRIADALAQEQKADLSWLYLSFVDPDRPEGQRFLGACWVKAQGPATAIQTAHEHGCNPGGQVKFLQLRWQSDPPEESAYKLHRNQAEIDRLFQLWKDQEEN
jgi:hypothetical protein